MDILAHRALEMVDEEVDAGDGFIYHNSHQVGAVGIGDRRLQ